MAPPGCGRARAQQLLLFAADQTDPPELREVATSLPGDLWLLGGHRLLCGDSTRPADVGRLMRSAVASCVIADPPYGMGKEKDGIPNDNLYREALDLFHMSWWQVAREHLAENGSLYVWGNAPDLWRLWYAGGLAASGDLLVRNEIVWNKGSGFGMKSAGMHSFAPASERCLFLMRGQQFLGSQNKADYWEGWDPLREWLVRERDRAGWSNDDVNRLSRTQMAGHWFGKSQFQPIGRQHYERLRQLSAGAAFTETYDELLERLFPEVFAGGMNHRRNIAEQMRASRTYFDNAHEPMTDVWDFPRVQGGERFGHATPKPVAVLGRCVRSSVPESGLVFDPFAGTGTVLVACELLRRVCYAVEIEPTYVDVAVRRWQEQSGAAATLEGDGRTFEAVEAARKGSALRNGTTDPFPVEIGR